ncbi:multiple inositol polyphosphate phosphatase 1 isoform X3 [Eurytemora carolleeae]|uniref:multiple inositol polyphosphate phosphatase 1 isoform X3 n=1 Tax=Eurytemora carolleeae TaxID=1294199 RepID=UPI000C774532|nr:multiple inositol polyphosphate phosphatase 1 isoform X3 [Eurytemora carolleeae]|eukprot:XP_023323343.1 multiple inositol polyphosphate phosphatase 1-like isoform X3 [Eurytemora affinis]
MPRFVDFLLVIAHLAVAVSDLNSCQPVSKHFYKKYSTKTPYQYIVDELDEKENIQPNSEDCQDVQVWSIVRHGTRYPSKEAIRFITKDVVEIRDRILNSSNSLMCKEDLDNLLSWKPEQLNLDQSKDLHVEGEDELIYMGERMVSRFPNLLAEYQPQHFLFRATGTQRAELSGRSFAVGLFSRMIAHKVKFEDPIQPHDPLLRFYKLCKKWLKEVKKNNSSRIEFDLFSESSHIQEIRKNLTALLGLEQTLTISDLDKIYVSCNFDQAWKPRKLSPWCTLFSDKALEIMEYREDLEYYWIDGPGNEISSSPACVLLKDVLNNFQNSTLVIRCS